MLMRLSQWLPTIVLLVMMLLSCISGALASDITGTYVGAGPRVAVMLTVVETTTGQVTGRLQVFQVGEQGRTTTTDLVLSGTERDGTFVGQLRTDEFLSGQTTISGTVGGGAVNLTIASAPMSLSRADETAYRSRVAELTTAAVEEQRVARMAAYTSQVSRLVATQQRFGAEVEANIPKLLDMPVGYGRITAAMRINLRREQAIPGGGQASLARGQLSVVINQQKVAANQIHLQAQNTYRQFVNFSDKIERDSLDMDQGCHRAHDDTPENPVPSSDRAWNTACLGLFRSAAIFEKYRRDGASLFASIEEEWRRQTALQDAITRAADQAVQ